jgi:hypothetical protein
MGFNSGFKGLMFGSFVFCPAECIEIFRAIRCQEALAEKLDF